MLAKVKSLEIRSSLGISEIDNWGGVWRFVRRESVIDR